MTVRAVPYRHTKVRDAACVDTTICRLLSGDEPFSHNRCLATTALLGVQVVHLIRHGQGFHNVAGHRDPAQYLSYDWCVLRGHLKSCVDSAKPCVATLPACLRREDAHLTEYGWQQVAKLKQNGKRTPLTVS